MLISVSDIPDIEVIFSDLSKHPQITQKQYYGTEGCIGGYFFYLITHYFDNLVNDNSESTRGIQWTCHILKALNSYIWAYLCAESDTGMPTGEQPL